MSYHEAKWEKDGKVIGGRWRWFRHIQRFDIQLDDIDEITGRIRHFEVSGDNPNFNGWKLQEASNG